MSAPLAVDDVLQITIGYTVASQRLLMVLHYRVEVAGTGTMAETQLQTMAGWLEDPANWELMAALQGATANNCFWDWVRVQRVKPTRTIFAHSEIDNFGGIDEPAGPVNLAMSIEKRSLHVGQKGVGRVQLGGLPTSAIGSYIENAYLALHGETIADAMITAVPVTVLGGMVLRPCLPAGGVDHSYDLFDAVAKPEARTMHRRTVGLGI